MRLNAPKQITWWIAIALGVVGIVFSIVTVPFISPIALWILAAGWLLLVLATYLSGL